MLVITLPHVKYNFETISPRDTPLLFLQMSLHQSLSKSLSLPHLLELYLNVDHKPTYVHNTDHASIYPSEYVYANNRRQNQSLKPNPLLTTLLYFLLVYARQ